MELESHARMFATAAHAAIGQRRKYTFEPYINHPAAVVAKVATTFDGRTAQVRAAAWLHDVVEDTQITSELVRDVFGEGVSILVDWLTDVSRPEDGNRQERKRIDREHLAAAPSEAQTIKVADLMDNTKTIVARDPEFAKVYLQEKALLLDVLTRADSGLLAEAREQLERAQREID